MLGTIVNASAIIIGCTIGGLVKKGIPKKYEEAMLNSCGLAACGIGFMTRLRCRHSFCVPVWMIF